jgi:hypothetical protein
MTSRRVDLIYFLILLVAMGAAYQLANRPSSDTPTHLEIPALESNLEMPAVDLPDPYFAFRPVEAYRSPSVSRPGTNDEIETALARVRSVLLASATPTEFVQSR